MIQEALGFKVLVLSTVSMTLDSPLAHTQWPGRWMAAECPLVPRHVPPVETCNCGLYAAREPELALKYAAWPGEQHKPAVLLLVEACGRYIIYDNVIVSAEQEIVAIVDHVPDGDEAYRDTWSAAMMYFGFGPQHVVSLEVARYMVEQQLELVLGRTRDRTEA